MRKMDRMADNSQSSTSEHHSSVVATECQETAPMEHPDRVFWRQRVSEWYSDLQNRSYFLPPVYMNRIQYRTEALSGQEVQVPEDPLTFVPPGTSQQLAESDTREDKSLQLVLNCLHKIASASNFEKSAQAVYPTDAQVLETAARLCRKLNSCTVDSKTATMFEAVGGQPMAHITETYKDNEENGKDTALPQKIRAQKTTKETLLHEFDPCKMKAAAADVFDAGIGKALARSTVAPEVQDSKIHETAVQRKTPKKKKPRKNRQKAQAQEAERQTQEAKDRDADTGIQKRLTHQTETRAPVALTHQTETRAPAALTHQTETRAPEALTHQTETRAPVTLTHQTETRAPVTVTHQTETRAPVTLTHQTETRAPATLTHQTETRVPMTVTHQTETRAPVALTHQTETRALVAVTHQTETQAPVAVTHQTETRTPVTVTHPTETRAPVTVTHQTETQAPVALTHQTETRTPVTVTRQTEIRAPVALSHQTETQAPVTLTHQTETRAPVTVTHQTETRVPVTVTHQTETRAPVTVTHQTETRAPVTHQTETRAPVTHQTETRAPVTVTHQTETRAPVTHQTETRAPVTHNTEEKETKASGDGEIRHVTMRGEVMFVISHLDFRHYLDNPAYADAAKHLPRPVDLKKRGDFDLLIIHRHYGILVCEIKSIGDNIAKLSLNKEQYCKKVVDRLKQAIKQLNKAKNVLQYLVSDRQPPPRVQKCVMLPYITSDYLHEILEVDAKLRQDLCECVGVEDKEDPCHACLTSDVLDSPGHWWFLQLKSRGLDPAMTDSVYLELVSRFGGPATSVSIYCPSVPHFGCQGDIRTEGAAVSETAWRFSQIVLHPDQLSILHKDLPLVFLTGPPGTGKTLMLVLKALEWVHQGLHVHVVSTWDESVPVSYTIVSQLQQTANPSAKQQIHHHKFYLWKDKAAVEIAMITLTASTGLNDSICIVMDEMGPDSMNPSRDGPITDLCTKLHQRFGDRLRLWAASVHHADRPALLTEQVLTHPLRTPPVVTRHVQECSSIKLGNVLAYTTPSTPLPCDGPVPLVVDHTTTGHSQGSPAGCEACGWEVAHILSHDLQIGQSDDDQMETNRLRYRDVVLLVRYGDIHQMEMDEDGNRQHVDCAIIRGLREGGVPVRVVRAGDSPDLAEVCQMRGPDQVLVTWSGNMQGLERKVLVWTQYDSHWGTDWGRLLAMSRCMAQLIILQATGQVSPDNSEESSRS